MAAPTTADLIAAIVEIREGDIPGIVTALLDWGTEPAAIVESCREAMAVIGKRFEDGTAFIPELIMAGEMMKGISDQVRPYLSDGVSATSIGTVLLGTVKGDIHDIGKDLVGSILDAGGFTVIDLGVDISPQAFVEAVREQKGATLALSCLLTTGFESMRQTVAALDAAGLRGEVKVMIGGAPITAQVCDYVAADGWGADAATALELAEGWTTAQEVARC